MSESNPDGFPWRRMAEFLAKPQFVDEETMKLYRETTAGATENAKPQQAASSGTTISAAEEGSVGNKIVLQSKDDDGPGREDADSAEKVIQAEESGVNYDDAEPGQGDVSEKIERDRDVRVSENNGENSETSSEDGDGSRTPKQGLSCTVKKVYEGPEVCKCHTNWVDEPPIEHDNPIESAPETLRHAILLQCRKVHPKGTEMTLSTMIIRSPVLKKILEEMDIEFFSNTEGGLEIGAPFYDLFYVYDSLESIVKNIAAEKGETGKWTLALLLQRTLEKELALMFKGYALCLERQRVTFDHICTIFRPKIWLYARIDGDDRLFQMGEKGHYGYGGFTFIISGKFIDWDGTRFGQRGKRFCLVKLQRGESYSKPFYFSFGVS
jgi:hypothetical protein